MGNEITLLTMSHNVCIADFEQFIDAKKSGYFL